jgi:hypothetical protein
MTSDDAQDAGVDGLDRLMTLAPDPDRAERVRAKCCTQLVQNRRRAARTAEIAGFAWGVLGPVGLRIDEGRLTNWRNGEIPQFNSSIVPRQSSIS